MTAIRVRATGHQLRRLADDARTMSRDAIGEHVTHEEAVGLSMEPPELSPEAMARVELHLASCDECSTRMEHLLAVSQEWRGQAGEKRLAEVSQRIREAFIGAPLAAPQAAAAGAIGKLKEAVESLNEWFHQVPRFSAALGPVSGASLDRPSPDALAHLCIREDKQGNLLIRVSTYDRALEGTRILIDPFETSMTLEDVAPDQVGGEMEIPSTAREGLAADATVQLRAVERPARPEGR